VADVGLDRGLGDVQQRGDLRVGQAGADLGQHLAFPGGELGEAIAVRGPVGGGQVRQEAADQAARGGRSHYRVALVHAADGVQEFLRRRRLEQETAGAGAQRGERVLVQVEGGEDEDPGSFGRLADLAGRGHAVHSRHPHIHDHHVGRDLARQPDGGGPVGCLADHGEVGLAAEHHGEAGPDQVLVVDEQHPDRHAAPRDRGRPGLAVRAVAVAAVAVAAVAVAAVAVAVAGSGRRAVTSKPPPGRGPAWTLPPYRAARSRIPVRP
jgi:hypothetical protein